jgi:hypothetical protein
VLATRSINRMGYSRYLRNSLVHMEKQPVAFSLTLEYFNGMEILQALSYPVIDQCGDTTNATLAYLSYLHIAFQPLIFNALCLQFVASATRDVVKWPVIAICLAACLAALAMLIPSDTYGTCNDSRMMCALRACVYSGDLHLAWELPLNGWGNSFATHWFVLLHWFPNTFIAYSLAIFLLPMFYGAWKITVFLYLTGPFAVKLMTTNIDEQPAIWCLMSIAIGFVIVATPLHPALQSGGAFWIKSSLVQNAG